MGENKITHAISRQFSRSLKMFREAILAFPPKEWRNGEIDYLRPAGLAYHVIEAIDFYSGDQPADAFAWGGRFGVDWEDSQSEHLPSQEQLVAYLDDVERKLEDWFREKDLMSPEQIFPWVGASLLERAVYLLRHTQHHLAEMCIELTRRGYTSTEWQ